MTFVIDCQPRFDYGRRTHKTEITENGVAFHGDDGLELVVHVARRPHVTADEKARITHNDEGVQAVFTGEGGKPEVGDDEPLS